ncbi:hypothetical protein P691DRAFT_173888 [Macrolepiota fuliginosa MF-IS2]|uniref:Uncharacterized protein n=1 Tax=Macrolepiota fuliginosa MF-IS2 TaxID=1400762 RepID=A0A9P6C2K3_9AGAR|nr:hypothetical protein P691DRAFT_173888 [Macrolepiota fuliginosa MF-IS2]
MSRTTMAEPLLLNPVPVLQAVMTTVQMTIKLPPLPLPLPHLQLPPSEPAATSSPAAGGYRVRRQAFIPVPASSLAQSSSAALPVTSASASSPFLTAAVPSGASSTLSSASVPVSSLPASVTPSTLVSQFSAPFSTPLSSSVPTAAASGLATVTVTVTATSISTAFLGCASASGSASGTSAPSTVAIPTTTPISISAVASSPSVAIPTVTSVASGASSSVSSLPIPAVTSIRLTTIQLSTPAASATDLPVSGGFSSQGVPAGSFSSLPSVPTASVSASTEASSTKGSGRFPGFATAFSSLDTRSRVVMDSAVLCISGFPVS